MSDTSTSGGGQSLGIGAIISESFSLSLGNFVPLLAIFVLPVIILVVVGALMFGSVFMTAMTDPVALENYIAANMTQFFVLYGLFIVIAIFVFSFVFAACIKVFSDVKTGEGVSIASAFRTGMSRAVQLFIMSLVLGILLGIVVGIIAAILGFVAGAIGIPLLAALILIPIALYIYAVFSPFAPIVVVENQWFGAIGRSVGLTAGYRWPIVGLLLLLFLVMLVVGLVAGLAIGVLSLLGTVGAVIGMIINLLMTVVIYGVGIACVTLTYSRLREIKEGTTLGAIGDVFD